MEKAMLLKFWGVHGSLPRPGPTTLKFGGNTACVEVRFGNTLIVFDAGSGIRELGEDLIARRQRSKRKTKIVGHIFFSHLHWDHVQGFPFFAPAFIAGNEFHLYGAAGLNSTIHKIMSDQMSQPNFPVTLEDMGASLSFHDLDPGEVVTIADAVVRTEKLNHPGGSMGYRVEREGKAVVYASDTELSEETDPKVVELCLHADLLIIDGMYTPAQYVGKKDGISRRSWGHSTWENAVATAKAAKVKRVILFHHGNDDRTVEAIERQAQRKFRTAMAAFEGLEIEI
ncbi:MAG: MBL fold metallo-hydrolase [Desulfomonilaceae bacterium]|nr:MBL fold metallo-hydrolase [Desulfomonilaceae bacterium]